jgi:hypothetical protein
MVPANPISVQLATTVRGQHDVSDGRIRFPKTLREEVYRHLIATIHRNAPDVEIALCLEDRAMFDALGLQKGAGRCNCVL